MEGNVNLLIYLALAFWIIYLLKANACLRQQNKYFRKFFKGNIVENYDIDLGFKDLITQGVIVVQLFFLSLVQVRNRVIEIFNYNENKSLKLIYREINKEMEV